MALSWVEFGLCTLVNFLPSSEPWAGASLLGPREGAGVATRLAAAPLFGMNVGDVSDEARCRSTGLATTADIE